MQTEIKNARSSNGRTSVFGTDYVGSNPARATTKPSQRSRGGFLIFQASQALLEREWKIKKPFFALAKRFVVKPPIRISERSELILIRSQIPITIKSITYILNSGKKFNPLFYKKLKPFLTLIRFIYL